MRYRTLEDLDPELLALGKVISEQLVEKLQQCFLKRGYTCLLTKTDTGASLIIPSNFNEILEDWWCNCALFTYRSMGLPLFVPVMQSDQPLGGRNGQGRNIDAERKQAVADLEEVKTIWADAKGRQATHANKPLNQEVKG